MARREASRPPCARVSFREAEDLGVSAVSRLAVELGRLIGKFLAQDGTEASKGRQSAAGKPSTRDEEMGQDNL